MKDTESRIGDLIIDRTYMTVRRDGKPYRELTRKEYELIIYLADAKGRPVASAELVTAISAKGRLPNTAEVYVSYVRNKLGRDVILNRRGFGYVLAGAAQ